MSYEIIWEPRGVVKRFFGLVTGHEILQAVIEVEGNARFDDLRYALNDFLGSTGLSGYDDVAEEVSAVDYAAARTNPNIRVAIIATLPEIIAGANEYAKSPLNAYPTRIFTTLAEARDWCESKDTQKALS